MVTNRRVVGVDESGKGDFFGPLVVASFLCDDSEKEKLAEIGVRDSKLISDKRILEIDTQLRDHYPHAVITVHPPSYNKIYADIRNLNKLLAEGHANAIKTILEEETADIVISDKFGKAELVNKALLDKDVTVPLMQLTKGERIIQVAAASIIARAVFIKAMDILSEKYGLEIPKGAAPKVDQMGREIVKRFGVEVLTELAKIHFKNYQRIVNPSLF